MATRATPPSKGGGSKWTEARDKAWDKARGVKEGSSKDNALDKKRGVPVRKGK